LNTLPTSCFIACSIVVFVACSAAGNYLPWTTSQWSSFGKKRCR